MRETDFQNAIINIGKEPRTWMFECLEFLSTVYRLPTS